MCSNKATRSVAEHPVFEDFLYFTHHLHCQTAKFWAIISLIIFIERPQAQIPTYTTNHLLDFVLKN